MSTITDAIESHITALSELSAMSAQIEEAAKACADTISNGGKLLIFGNGGSASQAQHFAAELVGRFRGDRDPFPAIALSTDGAVITAISNDYGNDQVFARQIRALAKKGDMCIGISTSGKSANVCNGIEAARWEGCFTIALFGQTVDPETAGVDIVIKAPGYDTARIQEMHLLIIHMMCEEIERILEQ